MSAKEYVYQCVDSGEDKLNLNDKVHKFVFWKHKNIRIDKLLIIKDLYIGRMFAFSSIENTIVNYFPPEDFSEDHIQLKVSDIRVTTLTNAIKAINDFCENERRVEHGVYFDERKEEELIFYKENAKSDFVWVFDRRNNKWFIYDLLTANLRMSIIDCVPTADKLQEIDVSKSDAENVKEEIDKLLSSEKSSVVAVTKDLKRFVSKSKEKKYMIATMKKVKVVPKSDRYTRDDIEQALNEAYDDYGYVLDFIKEDSSYVYIYFKEKEIN